MKVSELIKQLQALQDLESGEPEAFVLVHNENGKRLVIESCWIGEDGIEVIAHSGGSGEL